MLSHHFMENRREKGESSDRLSFLVLQNHCDGDCSHEMKFVPWKESFDKPRQCIKKQKHYCAKDFMAPSAFKYLKAIHVEDEQDLINLCG